jgi:hypothetical protein
LDAEAVVFDLDAVDHVLVEHAYSMENRKLAGDMTSFLVFHALS